MKKQGNGIRYSENRIKVKRENFGICKTSSHSLDEKWQLPTSNHHQSFLCSMNTQPSSKSFFAPLPHHYISGFFRIRTHTFRYQDERRWLIGRRRSRKNAVESRLHSRSCTDLETSLGTIKATTKASATCVCEPVHSLADYYSLRNPPMLG